MTAGRLLGLCLGVVAVTRAAVAEGPIADRRPIPPIVAPVDYHLAFQEQPRFPNAKRPEPSKPATANGLRVTIQPERDEFPAAGPLAFEVVLTNASEKAFLLRDVKRLGGAARLVVRNLKTGAQWTVPSDKPEPERSRQDRPEDPAESLVLEPGKTLKVTVVVEPQAIPVPLPQPRPLFRNDPGEQPADEAGIERRVIIAPVPIGLPCGIGECRARLLLEFREPAQRDRLRFAHPHWTGRIATNTVDFAVGGLRPLPPGPPVQPPIAGRVTREQAIQLAHAAAERALAANYDATEPLRPAHDGKWISEPEQTAAARARAEGGWSVRWTHFPRGRGFSYNVTVDVDSNGTAVVREVFTGYSARE